MLTLSACQSSQFEHYSRVVNQDIQCPTRGLQNDFAGGFDRGNIRNIKLKSRDTKVRERLHSTQFSSSCEHQVACRHDQWQV